MHLRSVISCSIGNILEWYDFGLFAIFAPLFSQLFFLKADARAGLIVTFTIFALGFFCRPIGALLFGYLGDKRGRASTLRFSVLMISLPTLLIGCLPLYIHVGIVAPILLILTRIWQGISIGGEYSGNIIYLGEMAPTRSRSMFTALAASGANIGILLAMILGSITTSLLSDAQLTDWGWRIPYLFSGILSLLIYFTRLKLQETAIFMQTKKNHHIPDNPIITVFKYHCYDMLRALGLVCMGSTFYYFSFVYLPIYLTQNLKLSLSQSTRIETCVIAAMVILVPLSGWLNDKIGCYRMLLFNATLITIIAVPGFYLLQQAHLFLLIFIVSIFTLASALEQGTTPAVLVENFPTPTRYTGISFAYNVGNGFLGGSIPLMCAWLISATHFSLAPAFYIMFYSIVTLLVARSLYAKNSKL